jgi:glutamate racemase
VRAALSIPVVGVVPPIKPAAAQTKTGVIGLLATPATVQRTYTTDLIAQFAEGKAVLRYGSAALVEAAELKLRGEPVNETAISAAIAGLFDAPGGAEIDVIALACTHFPLLAQELARAAPRPCLWLDSGDAIARRLVQVLGAEPGPAHARNAGFTDIAGARGLFPAFQQRGFSAFSNIGAAPGFEIVAN